MPSLDGDRCELNYDGLLRGGPGTCIDATNGLVLFAWATPDG